MKIKEEKRRLRELEKNKDTKTMSVIYCTIPRQKTGRLIEQNDSTRKQRQETLAGGIVPSEAGGVGYISTNHLTRYPTSTKNALGKFLDLNRLRKTV